MRSDEEVATAAMQAFLEDFRASASQYDIALVRAGREAGYAEALREVVERNSGECLALDYPDCCLSVPVEERCDTCWATARLKEIADATT